MGRLSYRFAAFVASAFELSLRSDDLACRSADRWTGPGESTRPHRHRRVALPVRFGIRFHPGEISYQLSSEYTAHDLPPVVWDRFVCSLARLASS